MQPRSETAQPRKDKATAEPARRKYDYIKCIQQHYGAGWEDVSEYDADSNGNAVDRTLLLHDLREYRLTGYPTRVIFRRVAFLREGGKY